jgi:hypothetical protein
MSKQTIIIIDIKQLVAIAVGTSVATKSFAAP